MHIFFSSMKLLKNCYYFMYQQLVSFNKNYWKTSKVYKNVLFFFLYNLKYNTYLQIYILYIYNIFVLKFYYNHICIYMCVCVCVCVCMYFNIYM